MKKIALNKIIAVLILSTTPLSAVTPQEIRPSTQPNVKGTITDFSGAVIPDFTLVFQNQTGKWKVVSDNSGEYKLRLPAGVYELVSEGPSFSFRMARLELKPDDITIVNVVPVPKAVSYGTTAPAYYYDSFQPTSAKDARLNLLIRYRVKRIGRSRATYEGCAVSYNAITLYADSVTLDKDALVLKAAGNVLIEDGSKGVSVRAAELDFGGGAVQITQR